MLQTDDLRKNLWNYWQAKQACALARAKLTLAECAVGDVLRALEGDANLGPWIVDGVIFRLVDNVLAAEPARVLDRFPRPWGPSPTGFPLEHTYTLHTHTLTQGTHTMNPIPTTDIARQLAAPFAVTEVKYKPGAVSGNRALAMPYVDARCIMDRLDAVLGIDGWKDDYATLPDGAVVCRLSCRIGETWIEKTDVGGASEQKDAGDRRKAAFSDALKRVAVKFGVGRYLYSLAPQWRDYDPRTKRFTTASPPAVKQTTVARNGYPARC